MPLLELFTPAGVDFMAMQPPLGFCKEVSHSPPPVDSLVLQARAGGSVYLVCHPYPVWSIQVFLCVSPGKVTQHHPKAQRHIRDCPVAII